MIFKVCLVNAGLLSAPFNVLVEQVEQEALRQVFEDLYQELKFQVPPQL